MGDVIGWGPTVAEEEGVCSFEVVEHCWEVALGEDAVGDLLAIGLVVSPRK